MDADLVDAAASILLRPHDSICPTEIPGKEIQGKAVLPGSNQRKKLVDLGVRIGDNGQNGIEKFVAYDVLLGADGVEKRRLKAEILLAAPAAKDNTAAIPLDRVGTFAPGAGVDQTGILFVLQGGGPDLRGKGCFQLKQEILCDFLRHSHLVNVDADLPAVEQLEKGNLPCRVLQIRILADNTQRA